MSDARQNFLFNSPPRHREISLGFYPSGTKDGMSSHWPSRSHSRMEELTLVDSYGQIDPILPMYGKNYLLVQNCTPRGNIFNFKRLVIFSDILFEQGADGVWKTHHRRVTRLRFGRQPAGARGVFAQLLASSSCSRNHFELVFEALFKQERLPVGFYMVLARHPVLRAAAVVGRLARFCARPPTFAGRVAELGSLTGTWIGAPGNAAALSVGAQLLVPELMSMEVLSIFHKEGGVLLRELNSSQLERLQLSPAGLPAVLADFHRHVQPLHSLFTNEGSVRPAQFRPFLQRIIAAAGNFSMVLLRINNPNGATKQGFGFVVVAQPAHCFVFEGLDINFGAKEFRLAVKADAGDEVPLLWRAVSKLCEERFVVGETTVSESFFLMVESAVIRVRARCF